MIRSMTGFGAAEGDGRRGASLRRVRSVNHRFFNPSIKLPSELSSGKARCARRCAGRRARTRDALRARRAAPSPRADASTKQRFGAYVEQLGSCSSASVSSDSSTSAPCCECPTSSRRTTSEDEARRPSSSRSSSAPWPRSTPCAAARARGSPRTSPSDSAIIEQAVDRIAARAPERLVEQRDRLRASVAELAEGVAVDEQRLAQEIALLADRLDVARRSAAFARTSPRSARRSARRARRRGQAARVPAAGDAARGEHDGQQGERRGDARGRDPDQGGAGADPRAGGEPRVNPFPSSFGALGGGGKTTIARRLLERARTSGYSVSCTTRSAAGRAKWTGRTIIF